ncbi:MAG: vWA domain-containing protein, partial [Mycobacteriaceae bacterium]
ASFGRTVAMCTTNNSELGRSIHLMGTVVSAAIHQQERGRVAGKVLLRAEDLRLSIREGREGNLIIFVVDTSGSMAARDRLASVTGAVISLLQDAYQRRDKVAVITMRGDRAELVLPPTRSVEIAVRRLEQLQVGGKTPLAQGFIKAKEVVERERLRDSNRRPLLVVLTDGRATGGVDPVGRARRAARLLAQKIPAAIVIDCEKSLVRIGLAREFARELSGQYIQLNELSAESVAGLVREVA